MCTEMIPFHYVPSVLLLSDDASDGPFVVLMINLYLSNSPWDGMDNKTVSNCQLVTLTEIMINDIMNEYFLDKQDKRYQVR